MARRKVEITNDENLEEEVETRTRPVRVSTVTREEYIKEVPEEEVTATTESTNESPPTSDIFSTFNEIVSGSQHAVLRIWRLPNYDIDGRAAIMGTDREYCGSVQYNSDNAILLDQISGRVPMGGTVQLELFADGAVRRRGLLRLMKKAAPAVTTDAQGTHLVINNPAQEAQVVKPVETVRETLGLLKDMGEAMRVFSPPAQQAPPPVVEQPEQPSIKDRILEGVILKAFSGPDVPTDRFDRVLEVLGGGRPEPSWLDSLMSGIGPHLGSVLKDIGPGLNKLLMRLATGQAVEAPGAVLEATSSGVLPDAQVAPEVAVNPAEYAWRRVLSRILDDCFEHAQAVARGALGIDVRSSAEAIADLGSRFAENPEIVSTISSLLRMEPAQVIGVAAMMVPEQVRERVLALKESGAALVWLSELQQEARSIVQAEADGDTLIGGKEGEGTDEDKTGN